MNYVKCIKYCKSLLPAFGVAIFITVASSVWGQKVDEDKDPMAVARGAKSWVANCHHCHNYREPREFRDDLWRAIMLHMRVRANLTGQETMDILEFLQESN